MTPTKEQVPLHPFTLSIGGWHEDERRVIQQALADAMSAGRDQGLREAKEVCEALDAMAGNDYATYSEGYADAATTCAAAIEQLRAK